MRRFIDATVYQHLYPLHRPIRPRSRGRDHAMTTAARKLICSPSINNFATSSSLHATRAPETPPEPEYTQCSIQARLFHVGSARSCCPTSSCSVVFAVSRTTPNLGARNDYESACPMTRPCRLQLLPRILECLQGRGTRRRRRGTILNTGAKTVASANTTQYPSSVSCSTNDRLHAANHTYRHPR